MDLHPLLVPEVLQPLAAAYQRQELHVLVAADHGEPARAVDALKFLGVAHNGLEGHLHALVAVGVVHHIHIPDAVVVVGHLQLAAGQVEGGHLRRHILLAGAVGVLQIDVGTAVHHPQVAAAELGAELLIAAVEDQQVRVGDLLHHQLAHVPHIRLKGVGVHQAHDLIQDPVGGQTLPVQRLDLPHTIVLDDDLLGTVLLFQLLEKLRRHLLRLVDGVGEHVAQHLGVVGRLALLAAQQQRPVLSGKAVLQDAVDEAGLAGIQETGDEINRNIHTVYLA